MAVAMTLITISGIVAVIKSIVFKKGTVMMTNSSSNSVIGSSRVGLLAATVGVAV